MQLYDIIETVGISGSEDFSYEILNFRLDQLTKNRDFWPSPTDFELINYFFLELFLMTSYTE